MEQNGTLAEIKEYRKDEAQGIVNGFSGGKHVTVSKEGHLGPGKCHGDFAWQPYPLPPFIERLDWVLDIFYNSRGMGWNWRISGLPPRFRSSSAKTQVQIHRNEIPAQHISGWHAYTKHEQSSSARTSKPSYSTTSSSTS